MALVRPQQVSFAGGEASPNIYPRVDINKYNSLLRTCRNFIIHPYGGASNRPGLEYITNAKFSDKKCKLVRFVFSNDQAYILEMGEHYCRFYTNGGQIQYSGSPAAYASGTTYDWGDYVTYGGNTYYSISWSNLGNQPDISPTYWTQQTIYEVYLPYTESQLADLKFERSADVIYIFHPDVQTQTLSRYGNDDWRLADYEPDDGPFMPENVDESLKLQGSALTGTGITLTATGGNVFNNPGHVGALFKLTHYIAGQTVSQTFTATGTSSSIGCFTTWRIITHGTWTGKFAVEKSVDNGTTWTELRSFSSSADFNANTYGTEDPELNTEPFLVRINMKSYTSGSCNIDLSTDAYYQNGIVRITGVTSATVATADVLSDLGSTSATFSWSEGAWSDYRGWPEVGSFVKDRFTFGATASEPMTYWMTTIGNYVSFARHTTLLDTDGITSNILSRELNAINGFVSLGNLLVFTSSSEWKIAGSSDDILSPTTVNSKVQGYRGSNGLSPVLIGNQAIYVQKGGKIVRNLGYQLNSDSFTGVDLRILSEHLFTDYNIIDMAYQQDNDSIVWFIRNDGILLSLTYLYEQEVVAWARHDTEGEFESIAVIPGNGYDEVWVSTKRTLNGVVSRFIERFSNRAESTDPQNQFFVDCGLTYDVPLDITNITQANPGVITVTAHGFSNGDLIDISNIEGMTELNGVRIKTANVTINTFEIVEEDTGNNIDTTSYTAYVSGGYARKAYLTFSGLSYIEGYTVAILGNGEVYPQQVVSGGQITLNRACSIVHIGLPYTSDLETMNVEIQKKEGTLQGEKVKIGQVTFGFLNSRGGYIGPDFDRLFEAFVPERISLGSPPELYSGDLREPLGAGYEDGGRVCYRQIDPLPVTITRIIPQVKV